jgi:hypothetical protein
MSLDRREPAGVRPLLAVCAATCAGLLGLLPGCGRGPGGGADAGLRAARSFLSEFLKPGADVVALSLRLRPRDEDYRALYRDPAVAARAVRIYGKLWSEAAFLPIRPAPGETVLEVYGATTDELVRGAGQASRFPSGYRAGATHLRSGLRLYAWGFARPGRAPGVVFDGLYRLGERWIAVPRPWRASDAVAAPTPAPAPAPGAARSR